MNISIIVGEKKATNERPSKLDETPAKGIVAMKGTEN